MTANLYFGRPDFAAGSGPAARILGASRLAAMAASPSMAKRAPGRTFIKYWRRGESVFAEPTANDQTFSRTLKHWFFCTI
jgi:hypothetical protein